MDQCREGRRDDIRGERTRHIPMSVNPKRQGVQDVGTQDHFVGVPDAVVIPDAETLVVEMQVQVRATTEPSSEYLASVNVDDVAVGVTDRKDDAPGEVFVTGGSKDAELFETCPDVASRLGVLGRYLTSQGAISESDTEVGHGVFVVQPFAT